MPDPTALSREVVARLPLAQAVLATLAYLRRDDFLDDFFRRHAGSSATWRSPAGFHSPARQNGKTHFHPGPAAPAQHGQDGAGRAAAARPAANGWAAARRKARDRRPRPPRPRVKQSGAPSSVYRLQQQHRASRRKET
jgi:hypothetical protein